MVSKLIYAAIASLDGYVADLHGDFSWAAPDEEVHRFVNELERPIGTYLYGRRMYETMRVWEGDEILAGEPLLLGEYAEIWRAAEKIVFSRTLTEATTARTRVEREFDPAAVAAIKQAADRDISIGGSELAAQALAAGLVDECHLLLSPVAVGAGKPALQVDGPVHLRLLAERRFAAGVVYLRYGVEAGGAASTPA